MEKILIRLLIITSACSFSAKYVFIQDVLSWPDAQKYCRDNHTDLTPTGTELEEKVLMESVGEDKAGWIGLYWDPENQRWRWSGGAYLIDQHRADKMDKMDNILFSNGIWYRGGGWNLCSFFCLNLMVVPEEKTWEEAQQHCRQNHANLTSLLSESENLLARTEIQQGDVTQQVWVGLRLLEDRWLWVDGSPLEYRAWNQAGGQEGQCPVWRRCGALSKEGAWEDRDCRERLSFICG